MSDDEDPLDDLVADDEEGSLRDDGKTPAGDDGETPAGEAAPLDDLVERARVDRDGVDDDPMEAFEEVDVEEVDVDDLWQRLERDEVGEAADDLEHSSERDVQVIDKREYCMRCQYFSAPPEVRCGHEHGEILEVVDTGSFEVADCPIVNGEEELENLRR